MANIRPNSQTVYFFKNIPSYFTRILIGNRSLSQMKSYYEYESRENINFIEKDGVNTQLVVNDLEWRPNYLIVEYADGSIQRWFVTDDFKNRGKQVTLQLKRDSICDYHEMVKAAPIYFEKCFIPHDNTFVYNSERMSFNQIKQTEVPLQDSTGIGWIIGYIAPSQTDRNFTFSLQSDTSIIDMSSITHTQWEYYNYTTTPYKFYEPNGMSYSIKFTHYYRNGDVDYITTSRIYYYTFDQYVSHSEEIHDNVNYEVEMEGYVISQSDYNNIYNLEIYNGIPSWFNWNDVINYFNTKYSVTNEPIPFNDYINKTIRFSDGLYRITLNSTSHDLSDGNDNGLKNLLANFIEPHFHILFKNDYCCTSSMHYSDNLISMERIYDENLLIGKIPNTANNLRDQPYIMFALPASNYTIDNIQIRGDLGFLFQRAICEKYSGTGGIYDVQYLPYCPINFPNSLNGKVEDADFSYIKNSRNENVGVVYFALQSKFNFDINVSYPLEYEDDYDFKVKLETRFIRLVSPNQQGIFEMNPYKNGYRGIPKFRAYCTYKPYSPFIYIEPYFNSIYGWRNRDGRGLICGGDFSLPQTTDAYKTYQLQNKNFINSFNRSIENMDVNYQLNREQQIISGIGTAISSTIGGAVTGGIVGGPGGAIAGGGVTALANAISIPLDLSINEKRFNESKSYATDQFNYNLQNIRARPDSLAKVGSIDNIFKVFPVMETYVCTAKEEAALRNKLIYNGMTANFISTLNELGFEQEDKFVQGQLIRIDPSIDNHIVCDIAEELKKGVFWK